MKYSRINLFISGFLILLSFGLGFYVPYGVRNIEANWEQISVDLREKYASEIEEIFNEEFEQFNSQADNLEKAIKSFHSNEDIIDAAKDNEISFQYYQKDSLILWHNFTPLPNEIISKFNSGEIFFYSTTLKAFICRIDSILDGVNRKVVIYQKVIEKFYNFDNNIYRPISLTKKISDYFSFDCKIDYKANAAISLSGLEYSSAVKNLQGRKIGVVTFPQPKLDVEKKNFVSIVENIQYVCIIVAVIVFLIGFIKEIWSGSQNYKNAVIVLSLIIVRMLLLAFSLPEKLFPMELSNPKYFSSTFAGGIAKTPLELFISAVTFIAILFFVQKIVVENKTKLEKLNPYIRIALNSFIFFSALLIVRAFAASARSFVFDSGVRYFNLNTLLPEFPIIFNLFNLLLVGFGLLFFVSIIFRILKPVTGINKYFNSILLNLFSLILGVVVYFLIDKSVIIPIYVHIILMIILFFLTRVYVTGKIKSTIFHIYLAVITSIISIYCLDYYNVELTKNSLKIAAEEVINAKVNLYDFWLRKVLTDKSIEEQVLRDDENENWDARSFLIWNSSPFMKEDIPCWVAVYDSNYEILGGYEYLTSEKMPIKLTGIDSLEGVKYTKKINGKQNFIEGLKKFSSNNNDRYLLFGIEFGALTYSSTVEPKFVSPNKYFDKISVNPNEYFIIKFNKNEIVDNVGSVELGIKDAMSLISSFPSESYSHWTNLNFDGEEYLTYIIRGKTINAIIGLKQKDIANLLFHLFKILFIHSIIISVVVLILALFKLVKNGSFVLNYRSRLFIAFLIIALVPIIFLAFYLRDLTSTKNLNTIRYKLKKRAVRVENYIQSNFDFDVYNFESFESAEHDLGIKFNIYSGKELYYSSFGKYYTTGILSPYLNSEPYIKIYIDNKYSYLTKNRIGNLVYNSYYYRMQNNSILEINDAFNNIILPIKIDEFDTILFGSYAIASIIIILLSTLLSNQISKPIDNLTRATKALSEGDLDISIQEKYSGEIGQLVNAFNYMTIQLKKNANEIARMEREVAWKEMAKQVAHEIKNPLTPMKLSVQHLKAAYQDGSDKFDAIFKKVTDTLINQIETLRRISSEFSNVAKMPQLKLEQVNVNEVIKQAADLFTEKELKIYITSDNESTVVQADFDHLKRTIINLIRNSLQAGANKINIELKNTGTEVKIYIRDNGRGIPEEYQNKIFDFNFTTKKEGMGIGLSIAKRFVENIGGNIYLKESGSNGSTFVISLIKGEDQ